MAGSSLQHDLLHNKAGWSKLQFERALLHAIALPARDVALIGPALSLQLAHPRASASC